MPTHSGKSPRMGLAATSACTTDIVISGTQSLPVWNQGIEARQGIIPGKSGRWIAGAAPDKARFWPHPRSNQGHKPHKSANCAACEGDADEALRVAWVADSHGGAALCANRAGRRRQRI